MVAILNMLSVLLTDIFSLFYIDVFHTSQREVLYLNDNIPFIKSTYVKTYAGSCSSDKNKFIILKKNCLP